MTLWIDSGYFYAGVHIEGGRVVNAAPILRYMIGWTGAQVVGYCRRKRWKYGGTEPVVR